MIVTCDRVHASPDSLDMEHLAEPWVAAIWGGIKHPTFWGDKAVGLLITRDEGRVKWDASGITILPACTTGISTAFHGLLGDSWSVERVRARAMLLMKMLRTYPAVCREWYRVEGSRVHIRNEFQCFRWGPSKWQADAYAPIPPIMSWGKASVGWPELPDASGATIHTPIGPYRWADGDRLEYSIPRFPIRHAAFPGLVKHEDLYRTISQQILDSPEPTAAQWHREHVWLTTLTPLTWASSILGCSLWEDAARDRLLATGKKAVRNAFAPRLWFPRKELFTGRSYVVSEWVDKTTSPAMFGDGNTGLGTSLYALYLYAKYSGDWELVEDLWPRAMDVLRYGEVVNDWAVPGTSARGGMLSVLFGRQDMIYLIDWEPAALGAVTYDRRRNELTANLSSSAPFILRLHSPLAVRQVMVDGKTHTTTVSPQHKGIVALSLPACNKEVRIAFGNAARASDSQSQLPDTKGAAE